jgi:Calcineurin-like phosphoesterase
MRRGTNLLKSKINNNIIMMIFVLSGILLFSLLLFKSSYAIKSDNNGNDDAEFDYIFDPGQYIEYKEKEEKEETTNNNLNKQVSETKPSESIIINNQVKDANIAKNNNNTIINNSVEKPKDNSSTDYNFIAAGDWYCNEETKKTINNILDQHPELIITTSDQVKESPSASCWMEMSHDIKDKMRIAIGNHDTEFSNIYKQIVDYHQLKSPYYSHDFKNIHFISMSTEHPFEKESKQYEFIKSDLEKTSKNSSINWIIVHQHKPLYSTNQDKVEAEQLRDIYQKLFQQYDVDLVISSHNQYYERTYPILYNEEYEKNTNKKIEPKPIITNNSQSNYSNKDNGIIFLTVGTAGDELDPVKEKHKHYVTQESKFGFLEIEIENGGKTLIGQFHGNDGVILDQFTLSDT